MRKILLATTALVAFAGAAQAAESPITVTAGGYVDFRAAMFHESATSSQQAARRSGDFATEYGLNFAAEGKAANGMEYGAMIELNNQRALGGFVPFDQIKMEKAYVWMSGNFGKVLMGDEHGASDLFVMAPTVGEGQIDGSYTYFTDMNSLAQFQPAYIDTMENSTKFTYYTPKVGNADHKVQLGVSYAPEYGTGGNSVNVYKTDGYRDAIEVAAQYTGNFEPVSVVVTPMMAFADGTQTLRAATVYGIGAQAMYAGFTFGASYVNAGNYNTVKDAGQTGNQYVYTAGVKYEFDKVAVAANYMTGEGYYNLAPETNSAGTAVATRVDDFSALGLGATYTWFPGLTSAADAVLFNQNRADTGHNNMGHVLMVSQKMAF